MAKPESIEWRIERLEYALEAANIPLVHPSQEVRCTICNGLLNKMTNLKNWNDWWYYCPGCHGKFNPDGTGKK